MVGTIIVAVTPSASRSAKREASQRETILIGAPRQSAPKPNVMGAPWNICETIRCSPSRGRPMPCAPRALLRAHSSKVDPASKVRSTPFGAPVVPEV